MKFNRKVQSNVKNIKWIKSYQSNLAISHRFYIVCIFWPRNSMFPDRNANVFLLKYIHYNIIYSGKIIKESKYLSRGNYLNYVTIHAEQGYKLEWNSFIHISIEMYLRDIISVKSRMPNSLWRYGPFLFKKILGGRCCYRLPILLNVCWCLHG